MSDVPEVDIDESVLAKAPKVKKEPKPKLVRIKLDKELVKRRNYCERCIRKMQERFNEELSDYKTVADDANLEVQLIQMQVQAEFGMSMERASKEGKLGADVVKQYSTLQAASFKRQKDVNNVLMHSPKLKQMRAWRDMREDIEEQIAKDANVDIDAIDWNKGEAEIVDGEDFGSMKTELESEFAERLNANEKAPEGEDAEVGA